MSGLKLGQQLKNLFVNHPHSVGETYLKHFCFASLSGLKLTGAGLACIIHSIFPFLFVDTASKTIQHITEEMNARKNKPSIK